MAIFNARGIGNKITLTSTKMWEYAINYMFVSESKYHTCKDTWLASYPFIAASSRPPGRQFESIPTKHGCALLCSNAWQRVWKDLVVSQPGYSTNKTVGATTMLSSGQQTSRRASSPPPPPVTQAPLPETTKLALELHKSGAPRCTGCPANTVWLKTICRGAGGKNRHHQLPVRTQ